MSEVKYPPPMFLHAVDTAHGALSAAISVLLSHSFPARLLVNVLVTLRRCCSVCQKFASVNLSCGILSRNESLQEVSINAADISNICMLNFISDLFFVLLYLFECDVYAEYHCLDERVISAFGYWCLRIVSIEELAECEEVVA